MKNKRWYLLVVTMLIGLLVLSACGGSEGSEPESSTEVETDREETTEEETTEETTEEDTAEEDMEEDMAEEDMEEDMAEEDMAEEDMTEEDMAEEDMEEDMTEEDMAEEDMEEDMAEEQEFDVSLTIWADDTRAPILNELAKDFSEQYGVGLNVEQVADIRDQFKIAAPAGEGPDIIIVPHDQIGELVASGLLEPLDLGEKTENFRDAALSAFYYEGEQYGMPYATENLAFFRNTDLVPDAPATWEEVATISADLIEAGDAEAGLSLTGTTYDAFPLQTAFGGYIFGRDADGLYDPTDVGVDSEGMIAAGEWLASEVAAGHIPETVDWDTAHVVFENGEAPFIMAGPWALNRIRESGVPYAISGFPDGGQPFLGVQGFVVNALSEQALLAQVFLTEFVATDETMQALFDADPRPSAWIPVFEATDDPDMAGFGEAGAEGLPMPAIPEMGSVWTSWGDAMTLILQGEQGASDALQNAGDQIRTLIEESS